jgi:hypothetical protein
MLLPGAELFSFGVKGGIPLNSLIAGSTPGVIASAGSNGHLIGPTIEMNLPLGFSLEADALYRPIHLHLISVLQQLAPESHTYVSSEIPLVGKYRFMHTPIIKPYIAGGLMFRWSTKQLSSLSKVGVVAGAGIELKLGSIKVSPEVRYVHWGTDASAVSSYFGSRHNQTEALLGLSF